MKKAILSTAVAGYFGYQKIQQLSGSSAVDKSLLTEFRIEGTWKIDTIDEELNHATFNFIE